MRKVWNILERKPRFVFLASPETSVYNALGLMVEKNIGALLITENGKLTGIFTERDYARKVALRGKVSKDTPIREVMTTNLITITTDDTIEHCMQLMTNKFIRYLPIVEAGELIGIISIGDVVKFIIEEQQFIIENLEHYITGVK